MRPDMKSIFDSLIKYANEMCGKKADHVKDIQGIAMPMMNVKSKKKCKSKCDKKEKK